MKKINIPIHRHTKVRRPMSRWFLQLVSDVGLHNTGVNYPLVTDLQRVQKAKIYPVPEGYDVVPLSYGGFTFKKKLGFWRNLWQNKIKKWWKENYNRKDKENSRAVEATIPSKWDKL